MARQKYSFKKKHGNTNPADVAKKKRIKKELNRTADQQEEIENRRRHKGDKLNLWKEEDMEKAVKEWVDWCVCVCVCVCVCACMYLIRFILDLGTAMDIRI